MSSTGSTSGNESTYGNPSSETSESNGVYGSDTPNENQVTLKCWNCKNMLSFEDCEKYGFEETCMDNEVNCPCFIHVISAGSNMYLFLTF